MQRMIRMRTVFACASVHPSLLMISARLLPSSIILRWADASASCSSARITRATALCSAIRENASGASSGRSSSASSPTVWANFLCKVERIPYIFMHA